MQLAVDFIPLNANTINNINTNFQRVKESLQDSVSRSGGTPNQMNADLDLNSNDVLNGGVGYFEDLYIDDVPVNEITGPPGPQGPVGETGPEGPRGLTGQQGPRGQGLDFDVQVSTLPDRDAYDNEAEGFRVLVSDDGNGAAIYSRVGSIPGVWSDPAYIGTSSDAITGPMSSLVGTLPVWSNDEGDVLLDSEVPVDSLVRFDIAQSLDIGEQEQARANIGAGDPFDPSELYTSNAMRDLEIADLKGGRFGLSGGIADPFSDQSGVLMPVYGGIDDYAKAALHFDGTHGSSAIVDSASPGLSWTVAGAAQLSTAQAKFGTASLETTGASGTLVSTPDNAALALGTANFTIDYWVNWKTAPTDAVSYEMWAPSASTGTRLSINAYQNIITAGVSGSNQAASSALTWTTGQWYHIAVVRNGSTLTVFRDGVQVATGNIGAFNYTAGVPWRIGNACNAYFDEFRLSVGIARWTAPFTPPVAAYAGLITPGSENQVYDAVNGLYRPKQPAAAPSYSNPGGTGDRTGIVIPTTDLSGTQGTIAQIVNGSFADQYYWVAQAVAGKYIRFDFGAPRYITEARSYTNAGQADGTWKWQGSNDGSTWTDVSASLTLNGATTRTYTELASNTSAFRYYQLLGISGNINGTNYQIEYEFKVGTIAPGYVENMTLISVDYPSQVQPDKARLVLQIDTPLTVTPGVDFSGEVSRDGINWVEAEDLALVASIGTIKTYASGAIDLSGEPAGVDMHWRAKTLTNKDIAFTGVVENWG